MTHDLGDNQAPPQSPIAGAGINNHSTMDTYAAYVPGEGPMAAPGMGQQPKQWLSEEISVPIFVSAFGVIVLLVLIYLFFDGLRGNTFYAAGIFA